MAWSVLQSCKGTSAGNVTCTATFTTANLSSGTTLIAVTVQSQPGNFDISSVKDGAGNSFLACATTNVGTNSGHSGIGIFALNTPAGDVGAKPTITATFTGTSTDSALIVQEVSGLATGSTLAALVDGTAGTIGGGTSTTTTGNPTYSSTALNEYLVAVYGDDGDGTTYTKPAALTADTNNINTSANDDLAIAYGNSTNGAESGTWALSGGTTPKWGVLLLAFKLGVAAPPPSLVVPLQAPVQPLQPARPPPGQVILAPVAYRPVVTLSGAGTLTVAGPGVGGQPQLITALAQPPQPLQPPPARVVGVTPAAFTSTATLSGSGTLTTVTPGVGGQPQLITALAQPPQPLQPPPSQITGSAPILTFTVGATLSGSGTLTVSYTLAGTAPYLVTPVVQAPQPPAPPPAQIFTGQAAVVGSATLTGTGTLAAAPFFSGSAALSGQGTLTASYTVAGAQPYVITVTQPLQPLQPPPARVLSAPASALLSSATLTGSGTLAAAPFFSGTATLSGAGTLTVSYTLAGTAPYLVTPVIQPPQPPQPPPGRLQPPPPPPPPLFTVGTLTASTAPGATSGGILTATTQAAGGPS